MTTFTSRLLGSSLLATSIALASSLVSANAAQALTINFDSTSTSTNTPATGASAQVDFNFVDVADGVQLDLRLLNTTNQLATSFGLGATDSEFVAFGFDLPDFISSYTYKGLQIYLMVKNSVLSLASKQSMEQGLVALLTSY
ncbi:MAG: hypothetical protein RID09_17420 [Coleofasciculus sp. G1-WW12-02]|uniref:hypothetical protein n=1 Tax=Coleofasciculus sp. G1-WW12-02 TaxID=3068483 RepID=UPI0032F8978F